MAYLMKTGGAMGGSVLAGGYSSYQLFKATLQFLVTRDLIKSPLVVNGSSESTPNSDIPVLMDGELGLNIFFKSSPWAYKMVGTTNVNSAYLRKLTGISYNMRQI